ncbi:MAG TPA: hypothetical protein VJ787_07735 [Thermoleophilia bacterium]|nr:hypothetical protein [Thermoleophilia bacterium]
MDEPVTGNAFDARASTHEPEEPVIARGYPAEIDRLEPLWKALLEHQRGVYSSQRTPPSCSGAPERAAKATDQTVPDRMKKAADEGSTTARGGGQIGCLTSM